MQNLKVNKKVIDKAVQDSSKIEGVSFLRAKKDKAAIKLLRKHGRAFSTKKNWTLT